MTNKDYEIELKLALEEIDNIFPKKLMLNEAQVAKIIGLSPSTLANMRKNGIGIGYKKAENLGKKARILYPKIEVAKYMVCNLIKTA